MKLLGSYGGQMKRTNGKGCEYDRYSEYKAEGAIANVSGTLTQVTRTVRLETNAY